MSHRHTVLIPALLAMLAIPAVPSTLLAQLVPPAQPHVLYFPPNTIARAPLLPELDPASPFTMEAWVYVESAQPYAVIVGKPHHPRGDDPYMRFVIGVSPDGRYEIVHTTGAPGTYRGAKASSPIELERWTHLAAVLDGTTMRLYVDGEIAATGTTAGASTSSASIPFGVGAGASPEGGISAPGITGALRQVRVWSKALTRNEIRASAQSASPGAQNGLAAAWPLDEGDGTTAAASNRSDAALSLGTAEGWGKPTWMRTGVLDSLDLFYGETTNYSIPTNAALQDLIPFDIDLDGDTDLIVTSLVWPPTVPGTEVPPIIYRNDGAGGFTVVDDAWVNDIRFVHPRHWTAFDADKDGKQELVIVDHGTDTNPFPGGVSLMLRHGPGGSLVPESSQRFPSISAFTHNVASGDFNGDGHIDVFMCNIQGGGTPSPRLLINDGTGSFTSTPQGLPQVLTSFARKYMASAAADLDGDGDIDLVLGGHDGSRDNENFAHDAILWNDGTGTFTFAPDAALPARNLGAAGGTVAIAVGDLDGDNLPDLVMSTLFQYREPRLQLMLANGDGTWRDASDRIPQAWPVSAEFGRSWIRWTLLEDLNGDGLKDLVVVGQNETPSKVYLNTGDAGFIRAEPFIGLGTGIQGVVVADLDGDDRPDIATIALSSTLSVKRHLSNYEIPTSIDEPSSPEQPARIELSSWPNPFNPATIVSYQTAVSGRVMLAAYDLLGRKVAVLVDGPVAAGSHSVSFDASGLPSGMYLLRLQSGSEVATLKVTLVR
jgi:hypothetical protein